MDQHKTPVVVTVDKFTGQGKHVHVTMREEPGDGSDGTERVMKFGDRGHAIRWINSTFEAEFSAETHSLQIEHGETHRWFYPEGD